MANAFPPTSCLSLRGMDGGWGTVNGTYRKRDRSSRLLTLDPLSAILPRFDSVVGLIC